MLDSRYYTLSADKITIPAGKTISDQLNLELKDLDGSTGGEELPIDETYLVPITISHVEGGVSTLRSSATAYYLVKRSSAITSAASLRDNWINFPTLDKASEGSMLFNNLTAVTYEAIIRVDDFSKHSEISTIMGVENYLLLRIGDASFPRQQLQFDGSGDSAQTPGFGKFPKKDEAKLLNAGEWYHIAATYSYATREVCLYVNGKLQSKGSDLGNAASTPFNLAGRAFMISICKTRRLIRITKTGVISVSFSSASLMTTVANSTVISPKFASGMWLAMNRRFGIICTMLIPKHLALSVTGNSTKERVMSLRTGPVMATTP